MVMMAMIMMFQMINEHEIDKLSIVYNHTGLANTITHTHTHDHTRAHILLFCYNN